MSSDCRSVRPRLTIYVCQEQPSSSPLQGQQPAVGGGDSGSGTPYGGSWGHRGSLSLPFWHWAETGLGRTASLSGWECGWHEGQQCWVQSLGREEANCLSPLFPPLWISFLSGPSCQKSLTSESPAWMFFGVLLAFTPPPPLNLRFTKMMTITLAAWQEGRRVFFFFFPFYWRGGGTLKYHMCRDSCVSQHQACGLVSDRQPASTVSCVLSGTASLGHSTRTRAVTHLCVGRASQPTVPGESRDRPWPVSPLNMALKNKSSYAFKGCVFSPVRWVCKVGCVVFWNKIRATHSFQREVC